MDGKLKATDKVVVGKSSHVDQVVNVVDLNLEVLALLKVVLNVEAFDPLGREVVTNDFSHSNFVPLGARLFVKYHHSVRSRKRIQVWQVLA